MIHETKFFEVRDEGTLIPVVAIRVRNGGGRPGALVRRAGINEPSVLLTALHGGRRAEVDPYNHGGRTMPGAHRYIADNWDNLPDGALVDVRVAIGETLTPCESDL